MKRIITSINEFNSTQEYDKLLQIRMDNIFDTIEEYKNKHNIYVEIKDVNFDAYQDFSKKHLIDINNFIGEINKVGKIYHCDFPTMWISSMDDIEEGPQIDELEIDEIPIYIEYYYTHVFKQFESLKRGFDYELVDRYKVRYEKESDQWDSREILELMNEGAFHSEYGVIGLTPEAIKECISKI
jgi:hypothetical protein